MADAGELQEGSNLGRGQVKAADYFLEPDIVSSNRNSGGNSLGGVLGGFMGGSTWGRIAGGINVKKSEANVTLSVVNARTTEEEALTEGYARKSDLSFNASGGSSWWGGFAGAGGGGPGGRHRHRPPRSPRRRLPARSSRDLPRARAAAASITLNESGSGCSRAATLSRGR